MFRFNFVDEECNNDSGDDNCNTNKLASKPTLTEPIKPLLEHQFVDNAQQFTDLGRDVIKGVYEGGAKQWQSANDLKLFLLEHIEKYKDCKSVLELGCGHALPAMTLLRQNAQRVLLQDYNDNVLTAVTMKAVAELNDERLTARCRFFSGDWRAMGAVDDAIGGGFELILGTDTVYNVDAIVPFIRVLQAKLAVSGVALIAGQNFYFGVGGGIEAFRRAVRQENERAECAVQLSVDTVKEFTDGVARAIVRVTVSSPTLSDARASE